MKHRITSRIAMLPLIATCFGSNVAMALDLDNAESRVSLVSTKVLADGTSSVSEVFSFTSLAGSVDDDGAATVTIDLDTVDTGIDIRNQRMSEHFFQIATYPAATITAQIPESVLATGSRMIDLQVGVDMHGNQMDYLIPVIVTSDAEKILVVAREPVLVDATSFEFTGGLQKLGELAGLLHIPTTVPVSFNLAFTR